ncbi:Squalene synthase [Minicystis rosea]|nr:Squalene synthase [Minicystis rosea]
MADIDRLLVRTSRTFALAIPFLPAPLAREVGVAYLLFRIADTFEDATCWPRAERLAALAEFDRVLQAPDHAGVEQLAAAWVKARPCDHAGYLELLGETPAVFAELDGFDPTRRAAIVRHTLRTSQGMADFVSRGDAEGNLHLATLADLKHYCYIVAGIVGELLTELFLHFAPLESARAALEANSIAFGEGLQLVNILKDADSDARHGRVYLPAGLDRAEILAIARDDLRAASDYVLALQSAGAPRGIVSFTALPVLLARATLDRVERFGAGSSISRADVAALVGRLHRDLESGAPAL